MNERLRDLADRLLIFGGLLMAATGILGEILGWWDELGLVFTIGGFLAGIVGVVDVHGRALLALVRPMAGSIDTLHDKQDRMLGNQNDMLGKQDEMLEKQDRTIRELSRIGDLLDERLPG